MALLSESLQEMLRLSFQGDESLENILYAFTILSFICVLVILMYTCCCQSTVPPLDVDQPVSRMNTLTQLQSAYPNHIAPQPARTMLPPYAGLGPIYVAQTPTESVSTGLPATKQMRYIPMNAAFVMPDSAGGSYPLTLMSPSGAGGVVHTLRPTTARNPSTGATTTIQMQPLPISPVSAERLAERLAAAQSRSPPVDVKQVAQMRLKAFNAQSPSESNPSSESGTAFADAVESLALRAKSVEEDRRNSISAIKSTELKIRESLSREPNAEKAPAVRGHQPTVEIKKKAASDSDQAIRRLKSKSTDKEVTADKAPTGSPPTLSVYRPKKSPSDSIGTMSKASSIQLQGLSAIFGEGEEEGNEFSKSSSKSQSKELKLITLKGKESDRKEGVAKTESLKSQEPGNVWTPDQVVSVYESSIYKPFDRSKASSVPTSISSEIMGTPATRKASQDANRKAAVATSSSKTKVTKQITSKTTTPKAKEVRK